MLKNYKWDGIGYGSLLRVPDGANNQEKMETVENQKCNLLRSIFKFV